MKFDLVEIEELSGLAMQILSVNIEDEPASLFDRFIDDFVEDYAAEVKNITSLIKSFGRHGFRDHKIKDKEGAPGDGIEAFFDDPRQAFAVVLHKVWANHNYTRRRWL